MKGEGFIFGHKKKLEQIRRLEEKIQIENDEIHGVEERSLEGGNEGEVEKEK